MTLSEKYLPELAGIGDPLLCWFEQNRRPLPWRNNPGPYTVWISEIMLQQTRVATVIPYYERFLQLFPTLNDLAQADEELLLKSWEGLGYYSRAKNLKKAAQILCKDFGGVFPSEFDTLVKLPGIGPYTAGAIASIAFGQPVPAVDGNVLRVFSRLCALEQNISAPATKKELTRLLALLMPKTKPGAFNEALMELGATICLPGKTPACEKCPIRKLCRAAAENTAHLFPVKDPKKEKEVQNLTVFLLAWQGKFAVCRREPTGLLANLWQLPNAPGHLSKTQSIEHLADFVKTCGAHALPKTSHLFTHVRWEMRGWHFAVNEVLPGCPFRWETPEAIAEKYAIPSAFRPYLPSKSS